MADTKYKVKKGDTLSAIAKQFNTTVKKLVAANPAITNPNLIKVGQSIVVPGAKPASGTTDSAASANKNIAVKTSSISDWRRGEEASMASLEKLRQTLGTSEQSQANANEALGQTPTPQNLYPDLKQDTLDEKTLAARFSIAAAILAQDESLKKVLNEILTKKIVDPVLQEAMLRETDWYKKNTDDWRKYQFYKESNPATYQADLKGNAEAIVRKYYQMGIKLDPQTAIKLAEQAMMKSATVNGNVVNYNDAYFNQLMADSIDFSNKRTLPNGKIVYDLSGKLETIAATLYKTAWDFGYPSTVSNAGFSSWLETNVKGLVAGTINPEDVDNQLQSQAKSMYPGLTDQISRGMTLREAADPWINALANEWEEDPRFLDLKDDTLYMALNSQDEKGNIAPMNLYQTKVLARKNPKWQYTGKAKEEYTNISQKILQDFGFLG